MKSIRINIPVDVLDELRKAAFARGLRSPQALIQEYIREGLRAPYGEPTVFTLEQRWENRIARLEHRVRRLQAKGLHERAERLETRVQILRKQGPPTSEVWVSR